MTCRHFIRFLAVAVFALVFTGCEKKEYDHVPPEGQGSILLDNFTADDINVFIDGVASNRLRDYKVEAYDASSGVHRLVLDQAGGDRYGAWDVDVVVGRLTVVEIRTSDWDWEVYEVSIHLESP
ncbi:MAG: hypothetical protein KJ726_04760 [Verrucomicrobia bacterium]|nr:hypothetical protein [Verrucomicrobiota bacterium]MBU1909340.1 hypothetical protein [Verrucomicrobiota bacterium]